MFVLGESGDPVKEGVYQYERHPAYLGAMLWGLGIEVGP